jgi:hypothetical protein
MADLRITPELTAVVVERAYGCCGYCRSQVRFATQSFSVEHIVPRSKGGTSTLDNLALSCQGCNSHKYTKVVGYDPVSRQNVPLFNPRIHIWDEHFTWIEDYALMVGLTATGRATISALRLNRPGVVNLREVLYRVGQHPPK